MIAVTVEIEIHAKHIATFRQAVMILARDSLDHEEACRRFDVCFDPEAPTRVFLYELYDHQTAFNAHRASAHFRHFDAQYKDWVASKRSARWQLAE